MAAKPKQNVLETKSVAENPDVGKPTIGSSPSPSSNAAGTTIPGHELRPQLEGESQLATVTEKVYWVGVTPSCPVDMIDCAGINFPKSGGRLMFDPATGKKRAVQQAGTLTRLTAAKIQLMREKLSRTVIRYTDGKDVPSEPGTINMGDPVEKRRGQIITIPTKTEAEERAKAGRPVRNYVQSAHDVPAARFMFAVLCDDQDAPRAGTYYPEPLEVTGLSWPGTLDD